MTVWLGLVALLFVVFAAGLIAGGWLAWKFGTPEDWFPMQW